MVKKIKMNWKLWAKKVFLSALGVVIAGGASVYAENPYWLVIVPALVAIQNYWKHK